MADSKIPRFPATSKTKLKPPSQAPSKQGSSTATRLKASSVPNLCQAAPLVKAGSRKVNISPRSKTTSMLNSRQVTASVTVGPRKPIASSRAPPVKTENLQSTSNKRKAAAVINSTEVQHGGKKPHLEINQNKRKIPAWDTKALLQEAQKKVEILEQVNAELEEDSREAKTYKDKLLILEKDKEKLEKTLSVTENELEKCAQQVKELKDAKIQLDQALEEKEELMRSLLNTRDQLTKAKLKINELEVSLDSEKTSNSQLQSELEGAKLKIVSLQEELYSAEETRKSLHNKIQDLKGNIRVFCRVRPTLPKEKTQDCCSIFCPDESTLQIKESETSKSNKNRPESHEFSFDRVFPQASSQEQIFSELSQLVQSALDGYNVCVFAYGQTGSGKTYTMEGEGGSSKGMIPRSVEAIFNRIQDLQPLGWDYEVCVSMIEIYNEQIKDLLNLHNNLPHEIRSSKSDEVYVTNVAVERVKSPTDVYDLLQVARKNRSVAATVMNRCSSRSHAVTRITINGTHFGKKETCSASLNLVDLAGSEKYQEENLIDRKKEANNINKSLSTLGRVILTLLQKAEHIPYRSSKLTHLLQSSLGGNSKTLMLVHISPLEESRKESLTSLRFASQVNQCKIPTTLKRKVMSLV